MPVIRVGGEGVYVAERKFEGGRYPPVVLVHGAGGSHLDWPAELRRLPGARVIALDLPGHGKSSGAGCDDTRAYAEAVIGLMDALGVVRAVVAGHSMGGAVALQMALGWPERVAGLVLLGTGSKLPVAPGLPERAVSETEATIEWIVARSWGTDASEDMRRRNRERLMATAPDVLRRDFLACQAFDVRGQLGQIAAPSLILYANADQMVAPKFSLTLADRIRESRLVEVSGAGHMFPLERAGQVAEAIAAWLAERTWAD